jgi:hypothetical protein
VKYPSGEAALQLVAAPPLDPLIAASHVPQGAPDKEFTRLRGVLKQPASSAASSIALLSTAETWHQPGAALLIVLNMVLAVLLWMVLSPLDSTAGSNCGLYARYFALAFAADLLVLQQLLLVLKAAHRWLNADPMESRKPFGQGHPFDSELQNLMNSVWGVFGPWALPFVYLLHQELELFPQEPATSIECISGRFDAIFLFLLRPLLVSLSFSLMLFAPSSLLGFVDTFSLVLHFVYSTLYSLPPFTLAFFLIISRLSPLRREAQVFRSGYSTTI